MEIGDFYHHSALRAPFAKNGDARRSDQVDRVVSFNREGNFGDADIPTTNWTHTQDLTYDTTYHWQVVAFNATGNGSASES